MILIPIYNKNVVFSTNFVHITEKRCIFAPMKRLFFIISALLALLPTYGRHYDLMAQRISTADGLPTNIVSRIWQTHDGYMWFETRSGLCRWDGYASQMFAHGTTDVPEQTKELKTCDAEWLREGKGRLTRIGKDGKAESWQLIPREIIEYTGNDHFHVADVDERTEAITTYGSGLYFYDKPTGELTCIKNDVIDNPYLTGLFVDRTGCIWIIEDYLGVKCLRMNSLHYNRHTLVTDSDIQDANHIRCLAPMGNGRLFCSNQMSDAYYYDIASGRASFLKNTEKRVYAALTDRYGNEWIGTRGAGLFKNNRHQEGLPSPNIFQLKEDKDGIWIAMYEGGVAHLGTEGKTVTFLNGKKCHDIVKDKKGNWWVAAEDSLYMIEVSDKERKAKSVLSGFFICLYIDNNGNVWAGSIGNGLVRCKDRKNYTVKSGLENDNIYSIIQDRQGMLWLGTEGGLSCLNPHTEDIQNYRFSDSQLANVFSERTAVSLPDGRLLFGTHDGIVEIEPVKQNKVTAYPETVVTGLLVNGSQSEYETQFSYTENNLMFLFSNFEYATLGSVLYQYILEGIDKEWSQPTKEHIAVYRNLPSGHYTFRVRSNNGMGVWGEETALEVTIRQPWWNTWWAWCLYIIALAVAGWFIIRMLRLRRKLDIEQRISAFKRDFYNRLERELRNPINVVQGATENVQLSGTSKTTVQSLRRGSRRMLKLMDMIQQFHSMNDLEVQIKAEQDAMNEETEQRFRDIQQAIHAEEGEFKELAPPPINEQTILIVEDDEDNLTHLTDTLNQYFSIIGCPSTEQCESFIQEKMPDLLILDITTDDKAGRLMTKHIHAEYPDLPIIHLSSYNDDSHQLRSLRDGATDYIVKPFSSKVLVERVKKAILGSGNITKKRNENVSPDNDAFSNVLTNVRDKKFLDQFQAHIAQHIADENFSVEQCAALMGLGRTQFYKRVKALTGETPVWHLHCSRLEYAAKLLRETTATIEEIMLRSGFHSPTYFYNSFKKHFGMSPKEYRAT